MGAQTSLPDLLARVRDLDAGLGWELGLQLEGLSETAQELQARVSGLEEERRHLQERLARGQTEYVQLRESMNELLDLSELSETISTSFKIEDILDSLMTLSARFVTYDSCGVFAFEQDRQTLAALAVRGGGPEELRGRVAALWDDGIIDWVLREKRPVVIDDMETLTAGAPPGKSFVIIPLMVRGKPIGIYTLHSAKAKDDFTLGEIELLGVLANQTAAAIENSRLYSDIEAAHQRLKESQRQLLISAKQAAIGELAGGVAHEVNNPLQIILSRVQLMAAQNRDQEKVVQGLGLIESNVKRISRIIRALLGFASHSATEGELSSFELRQAIQQAFALVKHQLDAQLIAIELDIDRDLPQLHGNVGELEQVFINLILNAQNAMPNGGRLSISCHRDDATVEIRFSDTGVGIAPEHLDRIFEPFFTTRAEQGGTGLGLAVSYRIVEMHGGTITVESEPGIGATFIVRLPLPAEEPGAGGNRGPAATAAAET
ncbi:MAG: ATP-binding protein [Gemmatimonadota bacterium]